jgi:hypothetical protein
VGQIVANMRMRDIINLLTEAKMQKVDVHGTEVRVWINPTESEFYRLLQNVANPLRGTLDGAGDLYVWDAAIGIHATVEEELGITNRLRVMLRSDQITMEGTTMAEDELRAIPAIRRAYGNHEFDIFDDSADPDWEGDEDRC